MKRLSPMNELRHTENSYSFLWKSVKDNSIPANYHFHAMEKAIGVPIVRGAMGIDVGSGCGYDTYIMAKNNADTDIVSIDLSDGVYKTKELVSDLKNTQVIKCSVLNMPIKDNIFDFAYSFGVLHHVVNPQRGLLEIARVLKKESPAFVYLYEDHASHFIKHIFIKLITALRVFTVRMHPKCLYILCIIASPFIFLIFSAPSKILGIFKHTRHIADEIPFNFGAGFFSLKRDLYDRFSAPIEHRFSIKKAEDLFRECGFYGIIVTRLGDRAGLVVWGRKK